MALPRTLQKREILHLQIKEHSKKGGIYLRYGRSCTQRGTSNKTTTKIEHLLIRSNANAPTIVLVRTVKVMTFSMQINKIKHSAQGPLPCSRGADKTLSNEETRRFVATKSKK